jgi:excisionase family DNA binding protein
MSMSTQRHAMPRFVTSKELAPMLGVKPATLYRWARLGLVPYLRVGEQTIRFDPEAVIAALSAGLPTPPDRRDQ